MFNNRKNLSKHSLFRPLNLRLLPGWWYILEIPEFGKLMQEEHCKFQASMGSIVNFSETSSQTMKEERNREDGVGSPCPGQVQVGPGRKTNSCSMYGS